MNKYYQIELQTKNSQIGKEYPQTECLTQHQAHSLSSWEFPKIDPEMVFNLSKKAILTDFLSNSAIGATGYLISQRVKAILSGFNLMSHRIYPVTLSTSKGDFLYFFIHLSEPALIHTIDYSKSVFYETIWTFRENIIQISSYDEYVQKKKLDENASFGVDLDKIVLTEKFNKALDMFTFLPFDNNIYITERLKDALITNAVTGIDILETQNFISGLES